MTVQKPIVMVVVGKAKVPKPLIRAVDAVEYVRSSEEVKSALLRAEMRLGL